MTEHRSFIGELMTVGKVIAVKLTDMIGVICRNALHQSSF